ncbi:MAG: transcription termination/antitermination protein NusA [Clostridia bacterium]|nr:transcription termination/antitermination protein NusA [Clostridia bacterium]
MVNKELFMALKMLEKEKGIPMETLCEGIQRALVTAVKRDYNNKDIVFCELNPEDETMRVFVRKNVVSEIVDPDEDMTLEQAQKYKSTALVGDIIEIELETKEVSRIAADKGKHVIRQGIREAEHGKLREEFQSHNQEIVTAKVSRVDPETGDAVVEIGKAQETLFKSEQIPGETLVPGALIKVYIASVSDGKEMSRRGPRATISRTHPGLVKRLFESEVPEIYDGTVEIKSVSREAGSRTKIAVYSADENVDAVGACIGPRGARVGKIVDMLYGEKIDIVKYSENPAEFVAAALAPADVVSVTVDENGEKACRVIVPDLQLSLAIGNKGQNARLAAKLTGWKIDIKPESGKIETSIIL